MKVVTLLFSVFFLSTVAAAPAYCIDIFNKPSQDSASKPVPHSADSNKTTSKKTSPTPSPAPPSTPITTDERTKILQIHMKDMSLNCPKTWETKACLTSMAHSNKTLASLYAEDLDKGGFQPEIELLKEHCAASTAALQIDVPVYAMKSAMTECANAIYDISESTKIKPPMTHYQLMVTSIYCLDRDPRCETLEEALLKIK
ncbi:MAG: hypothetical protein OEY94_00895 [Alphaproteobacteria bacterium]|nr:hypothetical protein [Alphaproteobacteria bacterium]